jgi:hypothetical protein
MKTREVALTLYFIASIVTVIATVFDNEVLMLLSKPAVIPAILFYYLSIKRDQPVDIYFIMVLVLNFIGDTIALLKIDNETMFLMIPFFLSYLLLLKFAIEDVRKMKFNLTGLILSIFLFCFLMYIMYSLIELFVDTNKELVIPVIVYGSVLGAFASIAVYCFYMKNSTFTFYLLMTALLSIVSDVFYIMFSLIFHFPSFNYFELTVQLFSYFFIVRYFVLRKNASESHFTTAV